RQDQCPRGRQKITSRGHVAPHLSFFATGAGNFRIGLYLLYSSHSSPLPSTRLSPVARNFASSRFRNSSRTFTYFGSEARSFRQAGSRRTSNNSTSGRFATARSRNFFTFGSPTFSIMYVSVGQASMSLYPLCGPSGLSSAPSTTGSPAGHR